MSKRKALTIAFVSVVKKCCAWIVFGLLTVIAMLAYFECSLWME